MIPRRRVLQLAAAATLLPPAAAHAAPTTPRGTVTDLGPASVTTPLGNADFAGSVLYAGTRGLAPNVVGSYDLGQDTVTAHFDIPTGIGIWAMCAVGTDIYVATHGQSDLYRLDTVTSQVTKVGSYPWPYIWNIASSPDGKVYLAISDPGRVIEYDPVTGTSRDLGEIVPGEAYARSVAADETTVYIGIGPHAHLIAIDRATGAKTEILPAELAARDFVASMHISDTHLAAGISSNGEALLLSKATPAEHRVIAVTGEKYITSVLLHGDHLYFAGRPSGMLYRTPIVGGDVEPLGVPQPEAATHRLLSHDGKVYGVQDGAVFVFDPATRTLDFVNLVQRGFKAAPEQPMSVHSDGRRVYVGGKGGADIHDPTAGTRTRLGIPGEPKTALTVKDTTYLGVYTQGLLYAHRPGQESATLLGKTGNQQDRPRDLAYDHATGLIAMSTQPEPGQLNGALTLHSPRTGEWTTYRGVVPRQSPYAVVCHAGVVYLGTNIQEGLGLPPATTTARLAAFDLRRRKLLWQVEPVAGAAVIPGLAYSCGSLYGITSSGWVFQYDVSRRRVTRTVRAGTKGSDLHVVDGIAYSTDGNAVYAIDLETFTVTSFVGGLAGEWFGGEPKLGVDPRGAALFAVKGRNLVRIEL
ncbi:hypothetical protein ACGFIF_08555 [Kribbella sp. NPDC049174]|uniref:hypothetical protein n=1 Tax=Kribbella sp. NPDC049174 TaxID=3364112 RepID=UPI00371D83E7